MLDLGSETKWGKAVMVRTIEGERYYWFVDKHGTVAMIPAFMVEED